MGKRVVIIGSAIHGCELAEFLVKRGRQVTIVDAAEEPGKGLVEDTKRRLLKWLDKKSVLIINGVKYEEIADKGLTVVTREGKRRTIAADSIIPALALIPDNGLLKKLEGEVPEIYAIGDCREPNLIVDATADGYCVSHDL
jgi:2,4-dienoyl-CoA reductase (NADPH2)